MNSFKYYMYTVQVWLCICQTVQSGARVNSTAGFSFSVRKEQNNEDKKKIG